MTDTIQFSPQLMVLARESKGYGQIQLAEAVGVTQAHISKLEHGLGRPSEELLESIAVVLGFKTSFFSWKDRVEDGSCVYHRKRQSLTSQDYCRLRANLNITRMQVERLLMNTEVTSTGFHAMDPEFYGGSAEEVAERIRTVWKLPSGPVPNLTNLVENKGAVIVSFSLGIEKLDAMSQWLDGRPPFLFVNSDVPGDRARFTLAHEVGHLIMHRSSIEPDIEKQADQFAASFLLPAKEFSESVGEFSFKRLISLKPIWKVSIAAMIRRCHSLEIISDGQQKSAFVQYAKAGFRKREPYPLPVEVPSLCREILELHKKQLGYSDSDLGDLLGLPKAEVYSKFFPNSSPFKIVSAGNEGSSKIQAVEEDLFGRRG